MNSQHVAELLSNIAELLEIKGENPFKSRAYQAAAKAVGNLEENIGDVISAGRLEEVKGIGKAIAATILEYAASGQSSYYEELRASIPPAIFELIRIPGLGPKKASILHEKLGIHSVGELEYACRENRLSELPGFGEKTQQKILQGIEYVKKYQGQFLLVDTWPVAEKIAEYLAAHEAIAKAQTAGGVRRRNEIVKEIDIVAQAIDRTKAGQAVLEMPGVSQVLEQGNEAVRVVLDTGMQLNVHLADQERFAWTLFMQTGSAAHRSVIDRLAQERGVSFSSHDTETNGHSQAMPQREQEIYSRLGLVYIEPELREGLGEVEAAAANRLPALVTEDDIQGAFHMHTRYSDGSDSIEEMMAAAQERGWQYIGIADHSQTAVYAKGLKPDRILEQRREIEAINARNSSFRIFTGIECDILPDGSLDYPDEILAEFDFVVASVHSAFRQSEAEKTRRMIRAMENPYVTMLGHMTGRILLAREGYAVDAAAVIRAAAETGTILEINASPYRLDVDWRWHRQAQELGVMFAINPDAHAADELGYMRYGTAMARKGGLCAADVLNTRTLSEVITLLQAKRSRR